MDYGRKKKTYSYEHGGTHGTPSKADGLKSKISSALRGGATDAEIKEMITKSGLAETHDITYDNVEMTVSVTPKKDDRFGPKDAPGQRGDMFAMGGETSDGKTGAELIKEYQAILSRTGVPEETRKMYEAKIAKIRASENKAEDGMKTYTYEHGGSHGQPRTYAGQYMGKIMEDEGGKFAMYDDGEGNQTKAYFMEDPGQVGDFVPDNDYVFEDMDGKTTARLAPGFEDQRNPRERQIGKEVMEESTKGASKIENLLEKLMDEGRRGKDGTRTYSYEHGGSHGEDDPKPPSWIASDPKFSNIKFIGSDYEKKMNQASGFGGEDFRFDLKGVKFYGMDDDGLTFIDENGNAFVAERDYETGNPDDEGGGYDDIFNYLKDMGAVYSKEYEEIVRAADEKKRSEPKGPVGTIIHKNELITGSGNPRGEIIDLREGREDLRPGQLRRGLKRLQREKRRGKDGTRTFSY